MNQKLLHILQHSLGLDRHGNGRQYRNHFCTGPGSKDFDACRQLVADGLMTERPGSELSGGDSVFYVTAKGVYLVASHKNAHNCEACCYFKPIPDTNAGYCIWSDIHKTPSCMDLICFEAWHLGGTNCPTWEAKETDHD